MLIGSVWKALLLPTDFNTQPDMEREYGTHEQEAKKCLPNVERLWRYQNYKQLNVKYSSLKE